MEPIKIVLRFANGAVIKGSTRNFSPNKDCFHFIPADSPSNGAIEVLLKDLKAVFMVRDFIGTPQYNERKKYIEEEKPSGKRIEVTFADGEVMVGSTLGYDRNRLGFFIFPADPKSNNIRVFVVSSAVKSVRQL
jgi:hypothetical protein